eukprot:gene3248-4068_t
MEGINTESKIEYQKKNNLFEKVYQELSQLNPTHTKHNNEITRGTLSSSKSKSLHINIHTELPTSKQISPPIDLSQCSTLSIFAGAQLSIWHDTAGPVVEQLWNNQEISLDFQLFIARQTLCGLDLKNCSDEIRFNIYPDQGLMVPSVIFNSKYSDKLTKFALSLYLKIDYFNEYTQLHDIISDRLTFLASKLLKDYCIQKVNLNEFTLDLIQVFNNVESLFLASYPNVDISSTWFYENKIDTEFFIRVLSSHLQTYGSTIVIGSNSELILKWMDTLSLFLTCKERKLSSRNLINREYIPDLMIQGLLDCSIKQIEEKVHFSLKPLTIVDTDNQTLHQTFIHYQYKTIREDILLRTVIFQNGSLKDVQYFKQFKDSSSSTYIKNIVNEVFQLPIELREIYLAQSMRLLLRKASLVVNYSQSVDFLGINYESKIKTVFNIPTDSDVHLLFGVAEKLQLYLFLAVLRPSDLAQIFFDLMFF